MTTFINIALVGDYDPKVTAHKAIPKALQIAAASHYFDVKYEWLHTKTLIGDMDQLLSNFNGVWAVPASPYENISGALAAIQYAREKHISFLGTCGGYQHALLEFAHNVLQLPEAENAEVNPDTSFPLINALICSLVEENGEILLRENTKIREIYGEEIIMEQYRCSYGFNRRYLNLFKDSELVVSGFDHDGDPRSIELSNHPFFMATAYQPERVALKGENHPLVNQFILSMATNTDDKFKS